MRNKRLITGLLLSAFSVILSGCGSDAFMDEVIQTQNQGENIEISAGLDIQIPERNELTWTELDQLTSYDDIRRVIDDKLQIVRFDNSSKNGVIYIDENDNWSGNNTLYNAFRNKVFVQDFWSDGSIKSDIGEASNSKFTDINNITTGLVASINTYYNILPTNADGTSGLCDNITRAEAMSAIYRADSPVMVLDANTDFDNAVGDSVYNTYASNLADCSFLDYRNGGLCYDTYNTPITRAEEAYLIVQRYFKDEYDAMDGASASFSDCSNAGDVATELGIKDGHAWQAYELEYCIQTGKGCPEDLYKALVILQNHGVIGSETLWNSPIMGGTLLNDLLLTYQNIGETEGYAVASKTGKNIGESLVVVAEDEPEVTEETVGGAVVTQVRDVTNLDDLFNIYGDEIEMSQDEIDHAYDVASKYTFQAADQWLEVAYCTYLNVRTGPSTDFNILRSIPAGTKCHVVAICKETGWYRIIADKKIVYQCGVYFKDFEGSDDYKVRTGENANDY